VGLGSWAHGLSVGMWARGRVVGVCPCAKYVYVPCPQAVHSVVACRRVSPGREPSCELRSSREGKRPAGLSVWPCRLQGALPCSSKCVAARAQRQHHRITGDRGTGAASARLHMCVLTQVVAGWLLRAAGCGLLYVLDRWARLTNAQLTVYIIRY
jgi:hypothetical protein